MQIALCLFKYFPHGGIQRDFMKIARECLARGHSLRVYTLDWQGERPREIEVVRVPVRALQNHERYRRYALWVGDHLRQNPVDLVFGLNKMPGLDVYYAGDSCYEEKARTQRGALYRLLPRYRHFARFERAVFDPQANTRVLTISDVESTYFRKHYQTPRERMVALPPGIERDRVAPSDKAGVRSSLRDEFDLPQQDHLLLFVGSGFIKKGLDRSLYALRAMDPELYEKTWLFVLGRDKAERFRRMAVRLGVAEHVRFLGGRDDVPRFLFAADGLLLPAYDENAGAVILEALVAGLPALVTANCGYAKFVRDADAGLVSPIPYRQEVFDGQVRDLLTSPHRARWAANGRALACDESIFQMPERVVDQLEEVHAQLCRNGKSQSA